jgi:hypothetical protein
MSTVQRPPERPVENYEAVRDEWIAAVTALMDDAARWCDARDWDYRLQTKPMYESTLGSYELPRLLIHNGIGRVLLDPVARDVVGVAGGAVELLSVPDYDGRPIFRDESGWILEQNDESKSWCEEVFVQAVNAMATW